MTEKKNCQGEGVIRYRISQAEANLTRLEFSGREAWKNMKILARRNL
ncbi:hypothetical protein [Methanosarcina mazei]|nr:hypothetical protein [Methanosarcina mazei]